MRPFIDKVRDYIERNGLLRPGATVVVGVSGGADSVALLAVLCELGYRCVAAHCNYHLRGEESMRDMRHVGTLARRLGVGLYVRDFDVAARRAATGESLEMACRELRYGWFADLLGRERAQAVAVAHHREDEAETFFLNLLRGTGLRGLGGMAPRRDFVVRPLLDCTRAEIEGYLCGRGIGWVDDSTNAGCDFARNRVRHRLMPLLEELRPGATDAVAGTMERLREAAGFAHAAAVATVGRRATPGGEVDLRALASEPHAAYVLYEYLRGEGFNRSHTDAMLRAAAGAGSAVFCAAGGCSRAVDHGMLRAPSASPADVPGEAAHDVDPSRDIDRPVRIAVSRHPAAGFRAERDPSVMYLDATALDGSPRWQLRHRRRGDRMRPYGMAGTRLLSDIYAQAHLSEAGKRAAWLLTRDGEILWAVGLRASARFAVGPHTKEYLRLKILTQ